MNKLVIRFFVAFVLCSALAACRSLPFSQKEMSFKARFPDKTINKNMHLWIGEKDEDLHVWKPFELMIDNKTKSQIHVMIDTDIHILIYDDKKKEWNEVKNNGIFSSYKVIIPPIGPDSPGVNGVTISPDLTPSNQAVEIRIVVIGTLDQDESGKEQTSTSYLDVTLKP